MARNRATSLALIAGTILGLAAFTIPAVPEAQAQPRFNMGIGGRGGMGGGEKISAATLDQFGKILLLTDTQADALKDLHQAYDAAHEQATKAFQDKLERIRQDFQDTQDPSVWQKDMPEAVEKLTTEVTKVEKSFMDDLKAMLTPEQASKWPVLERASRRAKSLPGGMLAGESVDLLKQVENLKLAKTPEAVQQSLERYEMELDGAMVERDAKRKELGEQMPGFGGRARGGQGGGGGGGGGAGMFDFQKIGEVMADMRKSGVKVRDINDKYATVIASGLPDERRGEFTLNVKKAKFPQIYRESYTLKALNAAAGFKDLDTQQQTGVTDLLAKYKREIDAANDRYAKAQADAEKDGGGDDMMGGFMRMMGGDQGGDDSELAIARKDRRKIDTDTLEKLKAILTPEQAEKLPERENSMFGGGRGR